MGNHPTMSLQQVALLPPNPSDDPFHQVWLETNHQEDTIALKAVHRPEGIRWSTVPPPLLYFQRIPALHVFLNSDHHYLLRQILLAPECTPELHPKEQMLASYLLTIANDPTHYQK